MSSSIEPIPGPPPFNVTNPKIMIVDDSTLHRHVASSLLEKSIKASITTAANGFEALKIISKDLPHLVLTDMLMPGMDGLELVQEIRTSFPSLPVILMTAHGSEELAMKALEAGAVCYIPKRQLSEILISTVESVLAATRVERRRSRVLESLNRVEYEFQLENDSSLVPHLILQIQELIQRMNLCDENARIRIGVSLEESLLNSIYHGNLELSSDLRQDGSNRFYELAEERRLQMPYQKRKVHLLVRLTLKEIMFVIEDEGCGFDVKALPDPTDPENLLKASGRGLLLIRTFMDEVSHNEKGNKITLIKKVPS